MFNRNIEVPDGYAERSCLLVRYQLPFLKYCFVLCHESNEYATAPEPEELLSFFFRQAQQLAISYAGNPNAFIFIYSGTLIRKRPNYHAHVFIIRYRWQKAWAYSVLAVKNFFRACYEATIKMCDLFARQHIKSHPSQTDSEP